MTGDPSRNCGSRTVDREQPPGPRHALELVLAAVGERLAGADDEVAHGARDENLAAGRQAADPRANVDGDAPDVAVAEQLALAGVKSAADLEVERANGVADRPR